MSINGEKRTESDEIWSINCSPTVKRE